MAAHGVRQILYPVHRQRLVRTRLKTKHTRTRENAHEVQVVALAPLSRLPRRLPPLPVISSVVCLVSFPRRTRT